MDPLRPFIISPMTLYFARHGESEANIMKVFANTPGKYGLTVTGIAQSEQLAERLLDQGITRIFASPLLRAQETADVVARRLGLHFETRDALREFSVGSHEGSSDKAAWDEYREVEEQWMIEGNLQARIGGGECFSDIADRFLPFVEALVETFGDTEEQILLIGHGGTLSCMLPLVLSNVDRAFAQSHPIRNAAVIKAAYVGGKLVCLQWTDTIFEF